MFWENFWPNFFSTLIVDAIIVVYIVRKFELIDRKKDKIEREHKRKDNLRIAVNIVWAEIEHNRRQLRLLVKNISKRPRPNLIYPALESSAWEIIDKKLIFEGLNPKDIGNLHKIYNRVNTINGMYYQMLDKVEWILLGSDSTVRKEYVDAIIDRSNELLDFIEEVIPEKFKEEKVKD